jgi:hypothetical protein
MCMVASNVPGITLFLRNRKQFNHLSYFFFNIVPLWKYTLLPATVKVLEAFLEAIFWNPFQLFSRFLNDVNSIAKGSSLVLVEETGKNQLEPGWKAWKMFQCCHVVGWEIFDQNRLMYCWIVVKEKPTTGSPFFVAFPSDCMLARRRMSIYIYLFTGFLMQQFV